MNYNDPLFKIIGGIALVVVIGAVGIGLKGHHPPADPSRIAQGGGTGVAQPISTNPNAPSDTQQQLVYGQEKFATPISLHVPADGFAGAQALSGQTTIDWQSFQRMSIPCADSSIWHADLQPRFDGYSFNEGVIEARLVEGGLRSVQTFSVTLTNTPWGTQQRTFTCKVNSEQMGQISGTTDYHANLDIPVAKRVCTRWTYVNRYDTDIPGKGKVKVFAGTFSYEMKPLIKGIAFDGMGTATVKMVLDPDSGQWTVGHLTIEDPRLRIFALSGPAETVPTPGTCPGP